MEDTDRSDLEGITGLSTKESKDPVDKPLVVAIKDVITGLREFWYLILYKIACR